MSIVHIRHIKSALDKKFSGLVDLADWKSSPPEQRERAFLSRSLAAYVIGELSGADESASAATITDGSDDNGIDAIRYDSAERRLLVVQSKWDADGHSSPSVADVQKLIQGFNDLINARFDRFNVKMKARRAELEAALDDPNVTFDLIFAHTGQADLAAQPKRLLDDLVADVNDTTDVVAYRVLKQGDIHRLVQGAVEGESITLEVVLHDWGLAQEPFGAYYGQIEAEDVATWWDEYGVRLFSKNLRKFIPDSEVNEAIVNTLETDPEKFWYFNNGVTVLAEKILKKPIGGAERRSGSFVCEGVSIVNGAQTVGCIGSAYARNPDAVKRAKVGIRFISLEEGPTDLATQVTRATNTQNRIERRDFVSLDPEQERLRTELLLENGKVYTIKTGEPDPPPDKGYSVTEATIALACALEDSNLAVLAKRELGRLWEDISKAPYKQIFNPNVSGLRLWRSVEVLRAVEATLRQEASKREGRARGVAVHGNRLVLHLVFRQLPVDKLGDPDFDFAPVLSAVPKHTLHTLDRLYKLVEEHYSVNYLASLFKNATKCRHLVEVFSKKSKK